VDHLTVWCKLRLFRIDAVPFSGQIPTLIIVNKRRHGVLLVGL